MFKWKKDTLNEYPTMLNQPEQVIEIHECKFCSLKFNTIAQMNFHLNKRHPTDILNTEETPESSSSHDTLMSPCPYCPKLFQLKIALVNHIKRKHMDTMSRNFQFYRGPGRKEDTVNEYPTTLNQPKEVIETYECKFCLLKFNTIAQMNFHLKKQHPTDIPNTDETPESSNSHDKRKHMDTLSRYIQSKRGPGRPRKIIQKPTSTESRLMQNSANVVNSQMKIKRGRGRPRKFDKSNENGGTRTIIQKPYSGNIEGVDEVEEFHRIGKDASLKQFYQDKN